MRGCSVFGRLLGFGQTVVLGVGFEGDVLVVWVRPRARVASRCGVCGRRGVGEGVSRVRRDWTALRFGAVRVVVRSRAVRVRCREHGVRARWVPWASHGSRFTHGFEADVARLSTQMSTAAVADHMQVSWRTVGAICERVVAGLMQHRPDRLDGLRRIGVDEISYRKGQSYLTVVVCHDTGRLVWASPGRDAATLDAFFEELGPKRCWQITHVSADMATWYQASIRRYLPDAVNCIDTYHVIAEAVHAVDLVRRQAWNQERQSGDPTNAKWIKGTRFAVLKNPENLSPGQHATLAQLERENGSLYRAYLLKEQLRAILKQPDWQLATQQLDIWITWAQQSNLKPFQRVAQTIHHHRHRIIATIRYHLTNARTEATNTTIRLITRRAYGFHTPKPLIAQAMLKLGGYTPPQPTTA